MEYKIHYDPLYDWESIAILTNILNGKSIKDERENIIKRRGSRHKSTITRFFKNSLILEAHIKKNIKYDMPGYEDNGKQLANFLFAKSDNPEFPLINVIFYYNQLLSGGTNNKEISILSVLSENDVDELEIFIEKGGLLTTITAEEFFFELEKCPATDTEKLNALRLYHNFDLYLGYATALLAQVESLIKQKYSTTELTAIMDTIKSNFETDSIAFLRDSFNIVLDDTHKLMVYPSLYKVNSLSAWGTCLTDSINILIGLHILELIEIFKDAEADNNRTESFIKSISDNTKLSILKLLKDNPMYGSQLAEKLNCTSANISHHTSELLSLGVLHVEKENNRVYLHLNNDVINQYLDDAKSLFN